jgi:transcriptional regulator with XRE-family HTH domain
VADLAQQSGVSRAMISKIERGDARPTASLLGKVAVAFGMPLSQFFAQVEAQASPSRLARVADRSWWQDPETRYRRRPISPSHDALLQLTEVKLPAGGRVVFPAAAYAFIHQQVWVLEGQLTFREGADVHELSPGDCLMLGPPSDCAFENRSRSACRYVTAVVRR